MVGQLFGLGIQLLGSSGGLLRGGGVILYHSADLLQSQADLGQSSGLSIQQLQHLPGELDGLGRGVGGAMDELGRLTSQLPALCHRF